MGKYNARIAEIKKFLTAWDYDFYRRHLGPFGLFCGALQIAFFAILKFGLGYEESLGARIVAATSLALFTKVPVPPVPLSRLGKAFIELTFAINLPLLFTYHLVANSANVYWTSSMVFCGLIYGLLVQPLIGATVLVATMGATSMGASVFYNLAPEAFRMVDLAFLLCGTMFVLAAVIRGMMQTSFATSLELKLEKSRLEQVEANFRKLRAREEVIMRFVRPSVVTEIALGKDPLAYMPQKITTSILFVDMRNYTNISETTSQSESYKLLNDFFTTINTPIFAENGEVDKIMGDAVMATFPTPIACINAAVGIRRGLSAKNRERVRTSQVPIKFGTGISYGEVLCGNFGSRHKLDRTIVGDSVNVGARLEQLTKSYRVDVLTTEPFINALPGYGYARLLDYVLVKGKTHSIKVFEIFQHNHDEVIEFKIKTRSQVSEAIANKEENRIEDALKIFRELIAKCPPHRFQHGTILDPYLQVMESRLRHLQSFHEEP